MNRGDYSALRPSPIAELRAAPRAFAAAARRRGAWETSGGGGVTILVTSESMHRFEKQLLTLGSIVKSETWDESTLADHRDYLREESASCCTYCGESSCRVHELGTGGSRRW